MSHTTSPNTGRNIVKLILYAILAIIIMLIMALAALYFVGRSRLATAPPIAGTPVDIATDAEAVTRGEKLARISGCKSCHVGNLSGAAFIDEAPIGYIPAPNLTSGAGGVGTAYTVDAWELAIRHGVAADGRVITTMPVGHYADYADDDLADLIAYLQQAPAVDNEIGTRQLMFPGNIIFGVLAYNSWGVNTIDHATVGGQMRPSDVTASAELGKYLVGIASCGSCHAENLAGNAGQLDAPLGPNLTVLPQAWSAEEFRTALRSGQTPEGTVLSSEMPWAYYANFTEAEIESLWMYLETLAPLADNTQ